MSSSSSSMESMSENTASEVVPVADAVDYSEAVMEDPSASSEMLDDNTGIEQGSDQAGILDQADAVDGVSDFSDDSGLLSDASADVNEFSDLSELSAADNTGYITDTPSLLSEAVDPAGDLSANSDGAVSDSAVDVDLSKVSVPDGNESTDFSAFDGNGEDFGSSTVTLESVNSITSPSSSEASIEDLSADIVVPETNDITDMSDFSGAEDIANDLLDSSSVSLESVDSITSSSSSEASVNDSVADMVLPEAPVDGLSTIMEGSNEVTSSDLLSEYESDDGYDADYEG
ncbi:MAG: hypothetical protein HRT47_09995 [Candidatus Caenarcaniphilales bacterium]|nr:hypothetical protein [Candidatus Caenarcaniphilales bacterium]